VNLSIVDEKRFLTLWKGRRQFGVFIGNITHMHIAPFIKQYHPEYYSIETYPADKVARIHKVDEQWGDFSNFGHIPVTVDGVEFDTTERLYQVMKFKDPQVRKVVYEKKGSPKMPAKHYETLGLWREDWPTMIVDAMKFCLMQKYSQSEKFREELESTRGLFIVEDQSTFRKKVDTWGVKITADGQSYEGPNLLGRLLMELRDNGTLEYSLPEDSMKFDDLR